MMPDFENTTAPEFNDHPGCHERHLRRRYRNPLFPPAARNVTRHDVEQARRQDARERSAFDAAFTSLLKEAAGLPPHVDTEVILDLKQRLDPLLDQCSGLGGDTSRERRALLRLYDVFHRTLLAAAGNDPVATRELAEEAEARAAHTELLAYPIVADLLRPDSPIERDELVPALLSAPEPELRAALNLFDPEQRDAIDARARSLVAQLDADDNESLELAARLAILRSRT